MQQGRSLLSFNRGIVSPLALARVDIQRLQLSAEVQTNWMPRTLGPMMLRPGLGYIGNTLDDNHAKYIEFIYSASATALIELTSVSMRVWVDDEVITRPAVTSTFDDAGWQYSSTFTDENQFSTAFRVRSSTRTILITLLDDPFTVTTTVTLQQSTTSSGPWSDVATYTTAQASTPFEDGLGLGDVRYYRIGVKTGEFTPGDNIPVLMAHATGSFVVGPDFESTFDDETDLQLWLDNDESGATSSWNSGGYMSLLGNGTAAARRDRRITVVETDTEHCIKILIRQGSVLCRIGTTQGAEDLLAEKVLRVGYHSLSVTPTGSVMFIRLSTSRDITSLVDSVEIGQAAEDMVLTTPWQGSDLDYFRWHQEGDVIFAACRDRPMKRIERQGTDSPRSWSVVEYAPEDGPFREINLGPVRLKGSALTGDITVTAERSFFKASHAGALFSLTSSGQEVTEVFVADSMETDPIRVVGVGDGRSFQIQLDGTYAAGTRIVLQRSIAEPGSWTDVTSWTAATNETYNDTLDNQIVYYRLATGIGDYVAPDAVEGTLIFSAGSITGIVRIRNVASATSAEASVLSPLGRFDTYTQDWREGDWSDRRGYPSALAMFGGRLFWFGKGYEWGSVPDQFDSFDDTIEGDAAPIRRSIGAGPIDDVNWGIAADNLLIGLEGTVVAARSSSLDEPLTQAKFDLKPIGDMGSAELPAIRADTSVIFVGSNGCRVYEITKDSGGFYPPPDDLTGLVPEIAGDGFVRRAYQRFPDRRLHLVRSDGTAAVLVFDKLEKVKCWIEVETDGLIEDVVVLPGASGARKEDRVYYVVVRTIGTTQKRFLEKWATEAQSIGAVDSRLADCHVVSTHPANHISAPHLEGEEIVVWQDGICVVDETTGRPKTYTVTGGIAVLDEPFYTFACGGLPYTGQFKSSKRALADQAAFMLSQKKKIDTLALALANTHPKGLRYGPSFEDDDLDDLPQIEEGTGVDPDAIHEALDSEAAAFPGRWGTDPRLCLVAEAPLPCTVLGVVLQESSGD